MWREYSYARPQPQPSGSHIGYLLERNAIIRAISAAGNPTQANGRMFWFMRKKFFESYFVFSSWRRR